MNSKKFAVYTEAIIRKLPYWFEVKKKSKSSIGAAFINTIGLELDDVRFLLEYAYQQVHIESVDLGQVDFLYRAELHDSIDGDLITAVHHSQGGLKRAETLPEFLGVSANSLRNPNIYDKPYYFVDNARKLVYVHQQYDKNNEHRYGRITVQHKGIHYEYGLVPHHVWNFLDEFGMLLDCKRLYCESNVQYKNRILDVFKNVANASQDGLLNGIARELSIREFVTWEDGSEDFIITDPMVVLNKVSVNDKVLDIKDVFINKDGDVVLKGNSKLKDVAREVSYISGIEMHQFWNKDDIKLYNELVKVDGTATNLLKYYTERLRTIAPIAWGDFVWNEVYWDMSTKEQGGLAFLPNLYDAKIKGFKKFRSDK